MFFNKNKKKNENVNPYEEERVEKRRELNKIKNAIMDCIIDASVWDSVFSIMTEADEAYVASIKKEDALERFDGHKKSYEEKRNEYNDFANKHGFPIEKDDICDIIYFTMRYKLH